MRSQFRALACGLVLAAATPVATPVWAQGGFEAKLEKKLAKNFIKNAAWEQDYAKAKKTAADGEKLILAYFTRSFAP